MVLHIVCTLRYNRILVFLFPVDCESITSDHTEQHSRTLLHPVPLEPKKVYFLETFFPCDPRRWMHRYFMLVLMCFLSFGSYYVYDNPAALQKTIMNVSSVTAPERIGLSLCRITIFSQVFSVVCRLNICSVQLLYFSFLPQLYVRLYLLRCLDKLNQLDM